MTETTGIEGQAPAKVRTSHWGAFDGVRAMSVMAVMVYHFGWPKIAPAGYVGVDTFFVLSGFLITWLLLTENNRFGQVSLPNFYARRALRLFPALAMVIVFSVIVEQTISKLHFFGAPTISAIPWVVFYAGNWTAAFSSTDHSLGLLSVTWSLAVEEQFYLLWPAVFLVCLKRFRLEIICWALVAVAAGEMIARFALNVAHQHWWLSYNMTITHSDGLLLGCALALAWSKRDEWVWWNAVRRWTQPLGILGAVALVLICWLGNAHPRQMPVYISMTVFATLFVVVDVIARPDGLLSKFLSLKPLEWTGQRSYGMYLWHLPLYSVLVTIHLPGHHQAAERSALAFVATFVVSGLSYWLVEHRFLRWKDRFTRVVSNPV